MEESRIAGVERESPPNARKRRKVKSGGEKKVMEESSWPPGMKKSTREEGRE